MIGLFRRLLAEWVEAAVKLMAALVEGILRAPMEALTGTTSDDEAPPVEDPDDGPAS